MDASAVIELKLLGVEFFYGLIDIGTISNQTIDCHVQIPKLDGTTPSSAITHQKQ
jgi:hypothetical protein